MHGLLRHSLLEEGGAHGSVGGITQPLRTPRGTSGPDEGSSKQHFGSEYERVTGFGEIVYEHEDRAARVWLASSVFWFVVVTSFGLIIATELAFPETFRGVSWLVFSRARPVHVEGVVYAWLTMMYWGAITYMTPRLLGTRSLWNERLGVYLAYIYNFVIAAGFFGILTGASQGREWAEFPWPVDVAIICIFIALTFNTLMTVSVRRVRPLYVSMWWAIAAPIWVTASIFIENVVWKPGAIWSNPSGALRERHPRRHDQLVGQPQPVRTVADARSWSRWSTTSSPASPTRRSYSHTLSLISFWGLIFVYAAVGDHHILQSPTPGWLKTIASVNSVAILIPVFAFFTNVFLTMRGQWNRFFTNLPLRFVLTGFIFYILVNLQGALQAIQPFNIYIHFTYFIIGHSHLALLGGFTILGMGVLYYVVPHVFNKPVYSTPWRSGSTGWSRSGSCCSSPRSPSRPSCRARAGWQVSPRSTCCRP